MRIYQSDTGVPDISSRYVLPRYYIPASLQTTTYLFIFSNTCLKEAKEIIDSLAEVREDINAAIIHAERDVESDILEELQTYLQNRMDIDNEAIEVLDDLTLLQITYVMIHFERVSAYREALQN